MRNRHTIAISMKETEYAEEQIVNILREATRGEQTIAAVCRARSRSRKFFKIILESNR